MLTLPLHHSVVLFFFFTRPYIVDTLDYSLTQEKGRHKKGKRTKKKEVTIKRKVRSYQRYHLTHIAFF